MFRQHQWNNNNENKDLYVRQKNVSSSRAIINLYLLYGKGSVMGLHQLAPHSALVKLNFFFFP